MQRIEKRETKLEGRRGATRPNPPFYLVRAFLFSALAPESTSSTLNSAKLDSAPLSVRVASLGLFILDVFEWRQLDGTATKLKEGVVGGGGTYAMIGARMWLPAREIGILVDRGNDWPEEVEETLQGFGKEMWVYREQPHRPTTRALNLYTGEHRDFKYLTPRTRLEPIDLPAALRTCSFLHFVCSPTRSLVIHSQLTPSFRPDLCYEPIPDRCVPSELPALREILPRLAIFSPNHEEAWAFFGVGVEEVERRGKEGIEEVAGRFFEEGAAGIVVIRSGGLGAYAIRKGEEKGVWVAAYHSYESVGKVVDVTGAGNSFLGGLMAGLELYPDDLTKAVQMASISASYIIEQFGLARIETDEAGVERWNASLPSDRLAEMRERAARR